MQDANTNQTKFLKALEQFTNAAANLRNVYEELEGQDVDSCAYPFPQSFDEVSWDIAAWLDSVRAVSRRCN